MTTYEIASFGALLKAFRTRRHLTQQQLAEAVGVHRNAIGRWEQGNFLPARKSMVLELVHCLRLDEQEGRQLLEASLTALVPHWMVPLKRNPLFTGREKMLEELHTRLGVNQTVALTQSTALHGLGGIGKTQIALEYAYRYALEYTAIFWIGVDTTENIISSFLQVAEFLQLPERDDENHMHTVAAVGRWLSTHDQWLLIWDNLEDLALLDRFLPSTLPGAILLTTRSQALGTLAQGIDLEPMGWEEGMLFVLRRAKILKQEATYEHMQDFAGSNPGEYAAAAELVTAMAALPLALDQAAAYIEETGCSLARYLQHYQQQSIHFLARRGGPGSDHPQSVSTTFHLSMQRVEQEMHAAADIMRVCALLHAEAIPEEVFLAGAAHLGPDLAFLAAEPSRFDQAMAVLRNLSLVRRHPETGTLSLHRLVQVVLHERMSEQEQVLWQGRVIHALNALFPEVAFESTAASWKQCERLLAHVLAVVGTTSDQEADQAFVQMLGKAAEYLRERVQYEQAKALYERALRLGEQLLEPMHPELAYPLTGLANLYQEQGRFELAESLYERALHIREHAFGPQHPLVAHPLNGLAVLFQRQGNFEQAEPLFQRALSIWEQTLGPMHPLVSRPLNGLAILSKRLGRPEQAEVLYERALSIQRQALGPDHPQIVRLLYNLALLYEEQGKYAQAEPLYQQSLQLGEQLWGSDHPNLAHPLHGLGILYQEQEKDELAEPLIRRALFLWQETLGPEHLLVAYPLYTLATLLQKQGSYAQAEDFLQKAVHIVEQALGPEHPQVAFPLNGLADLYAAQGKETQAELFYIRALQIREQTLGSEHPDLASSLNGLANLYASQEKQKQAEPLYQRALSIRELHLVYAHPETAQTLHDLALLRQKQGRASEALSLADRALSIRSQVLGETHAKVVATRTVYTQLLQEQAQGRNTDRENATDSHTDISSSPQKDEHSTEKAPPAFDEGVISSPLENDPAQEFFHQCCELHPLAQCRISDLWHAYKDWSVFHQKQVPLSRRDFAAQVEALGCRIGRTSAARLWRGIKLVNTNL